MLLDLSAHEAEFLKETLTRAYQDLREEIYKTEDFKFKRDLHEKERMLESLLKKLVQQEAAVN